MRSIKVCWHKGSVQIDQQSQRRAPIHSIAARRFQASFFSFYFPPISNHKEHHINACDHHNHTADNIQDAVNDECNKFCQIIHMIASLPSDLLNDGRLKHEQAGFQIVHTFQIRSYQNGPCFIGNTCLLCFPCIIQSPIGMRLFITRIGQITHIRV